MVERVPQTPTPWWRDAVMYQIYIRSFADGNGDGIGDIPGIRSRLPYLRDLGVDGLWITPWYPSPMKDGGHDVADYTDIEPLFGTLADARALVDEAHALGLKIIVDFVANHTSDEHLWFTAAAAQPDLNWDHAGVRADFADMLRFWFDCGLDGLRMDAASGPAKDPVILREWRAIADSYEGKRIYVGEVVVNGAERLARNLRPDELHTTFNLDFLKSPLDPARLRETIEDTLTSFATVGAPATWTLSNHDETRRRTARSAPAEPGRCCCSCWVCPARSTCTRAKNSACGRSRIWPTSTSPIRSGRPPGT
jgi:alpha-glucosidase